MAFERAERKGKVDVKRHQELSIRKGIETSVLDHLVLKRVMLTIFRRFR